ncbi:MAG: Tc toxin subunit A, partial [Anaerolineae bacterium]|nr:Tc toxin subunit A [Anaerolineae bacterium]
DAVASPYMRGTLFNNIQIPPSFIEYLEQIPAYNKLFGSLDFIECDHCRSIFGPAAYFVDLMRFVEKNITQNENAIPDGHKLEDRRPDLAHIPLDCHNTYDLIPYIDLVNEVLEAIVRTEDTPDAYQVLEEANFPMNLPFNLPLVEIRSYLKQLKTSLDQIYKAFETTPHDKWNPITREFLELSPQEFSLIISEISNPTDFLKYYGDVPLTGEEGLENVAVFLEQTGLTRKELNDLIFQDLDRHEVNAGLSRLFFINNVDDGLGHLIIEQDPNRPNDPTYDTETLVNLSYEKLDRIYRFLKLARKLDWSFAELDWALRSLQEPCIPEKVLKFDGINDYVACRTVANLDLDSFTIEAWVNPARLGKNPIVAKGSQAGDDGKHETHFLFWIDSEGKLAFYDDQTTEDAYARSLRPIPAGVFSHVAMTVENSTVKFYINGELDSEATIKGITPKGTDLDIGRNLNDDYFEGVIKEVRIWKGARSQEAIAGNRCRRSTGRENDLVGHWPLTETRGNTLLDHTRNGNNGVMGGDEFITQPTWVHRDLVLDPMPESNGYHFNGNDQYLAARDVKGLDTNQLTIEAWIQLDQDSDRYIIGKENRVKTGGADQRHIHFLLRVREEDGKLVFKRGSEDYSSTGSIEVDKLTHVCVTLAEQELEFYINGVLDNTVPKVSPLPSSDALLGSELVVGRSFDGTHYYKGLLKEVRIWDSIRTGDQIAMYMHRSVPTGAPGLIGYWRLDKIEEGKATDIPYNQNDPKDGLYEFSSKFAKDLSYNHNDLYLGGVPQDYMPDRVAADMLLPETPIATEGTVLEFDGENDVIIIQNPGNAGLGTYERLTLELWFKATDASRAEQKQVIYTQGDKEAGLNVYLFKGRLYVIAWCANYEGKNPQETVFSTDAIEYGKWHHLAVTNDESRSLESVEFKAYLDGEPFGESTEGFRLSPVGAAYLGGLVENAITRFKDAYSETGSQPLYFFAGQITDFRLWKKVKTVTEIKKERYAAPTEMDEDLVAYLALDEGNVVFVALEPDAESKDAHSHYNAPGVLAWTNYVYSGKMYITDETSGVG